MLREIKSARSIFHTQRPRDTKTTVHLLLVFSSFLCALAVAIVFAESRTLDNPLALQKTQAATK